MLSTFSTISVVVGRGGGGISATEVVLLATDIVVGVIVRALIAADVEVGMLAGILLAADIFRYGLTTEDATDVDFFS